MRNLAEQSDPFARLQWLHICLNSLIEGAHAACCDVQEDISEVADANVHAERGAVFTMIAADYLKRAQAAVDDIAKSRFKTGDPRASTS